MTGFYVRVVKEMVRSSLWVGGSKEARLLWVTVLCLADLDGYVWSSLPGLAHEARLTIEETKSALGELMAPDEFSRSKEEGGRRMVEVDGGWRVVTYAKYRDAQTPRQAAEAARKRAERASRGNSSPPTPPSLPEDQNQNQNQNQNKKSPECPSCPADTPDTPDVRPVDSTPAALPLPPGGSKGKGRRLDAPEGYADVVAAYHEQYAQARGEKPTFESRQGSAIKALLKAKGKDGAIAVLTKVYAVGNFWRDKATIVQIASDPDRYTGQTSNSTNTKSASSVPRQRGTVEWKPAKEFS